MLQTNEIQYGDSSTEFLGYYAFEDTLPAKRPAILIVHDWSGRNEFACQKAEEIAKLGFIGFAVDMYGKGKIGNTNDEKTTLMKPLIDDRGVLAQRILSAFDKVKQLKEVDPNQIGAIGFCFGGLCV